MSIRARNDRWRTHASQSWNIVQRALAPMLRSGGMPDDHGAIDVRDYGARGDGVRDDTASIQQAFTVAVQGHLGTTVLLPAGTYKITRTLVLSDATGLVVKGSGGRTRLQWAGNSADALLQLSSVQHCRFEDFSINATAAAPLAIGVRMMTAPNTLFVSRHNTFRSVNLDGTNGG